MTYRYERSPEELYALRVAVGEQAELLSDLHTGIEKARSVSIPIYKVVLSPTLFTVYSLDLSDNGVSALHFTRGGDASHCIYRNF